MALDAATGEQRWLLQYPAEGQLDYGNSPRATPLIHDGLVYLLGAFGHCTCADLTTGAILWQRELARDFRTPPLDWGLTGSPLLDGERLYVQPGGTRGSIVALDALSGESIWSAGTAPPGHSSLVLAPHPSGQQLIGYDKHSLGGWDLETGRRLWSHIPPTTGDFNVPTPIIVGETLFIATENNGARLYAFQIDGSLAAEPLAEYPELCPDAHSPVVVGHRVYGVAGGLHCLDLTRRLEPVWTADDDAFQGYAALIASGARLLCLTDRAKLMLIDAAADEYRELGRWQLGGERAETLSHPALMNRRLFVRIGTELTCLELDDVR